MPSLGCLPPACLKEHSGGVSVARWWGMHSACEHRTRLQDKHGQTTSKHCFDGLMHGVFWRSDSEVQISIAHLRLAWRAFQTLLQDSALCPCHGCFHCLQHRHFGTSPLCFLLYRGISSSGHLQVEKCISFKSWAQHSAGAELAKCPRPCQTHFEVCVPPKMRKVAVVTVMIMMMMMMSLNGNNWLL